MSKYDKVYEMLAVVETSDLPFSWSNCNRCLMGTAREEGFFGLGRCVTTDMMQDFLGLAVWQFDALYTGFFVNPHLATDKAGAVKWARELLAEWEADEAVARAASEARLHDAWVPLHA
jgi:hypothetical protein